MSALQASGHEDDFSRRHLPPMAQWPELRFGEQHSPHIDLFNHGAHDFMWYGEDYAFCRRWVEKCGELWIMPDLNIDHHGDDGKVYAGNFHRYMLGWQ
jgi:hypothetical protein